MDRIRSRIPAKLSLEDYVRFIASGKQYDLTWELLKQVIHMHGFTKGKKSKSILMDAVQSIELMEARRSSLKDDGVSANAFISLGEVVKDLGELKWQECCITDTQMVNSSNYNFPLALTEQVSTSIAAISTSSSKKRKLATIEDATIGVDEGVGSAESACCSGREGGQKEGTAVRSTTFVVR